MARLSGMKVAILVVDGFEQVELTEPRKALEGEGATATVISEKSGKVRGFNHVDKADEIGVDATFADAHPDDYDAVLLPGGVVNGDALRVVPEAQRFVTKIAEDGKPIAVICHGPWLLVSAGLMKGRTLTSWPTLKDDIVNAGGTWIDQEVCIDGRLVSSRKPADIPAFNEKMLEVFAIAFRGAHREPAPA